MKLFPWFLVFLLAAATGASSAVVLRPPERFRSCTPEVPPVVKRVPTRNLDQICDKLGGSRTRACTKVNPAPEPSVIYLPYDADYRTLAELEEHERAHVCGWPADHSS